jgi:two-component system cell cycle response regulator
MSNWQVLIVEVEYDSIQMVSKILTHHGVEISVVNDGFQCMEALRDMEPTLIVMDLSLPGMNGWDTLIAIRSDPHLAHIPVVAVTAFDSVDVAEDAYKAGFDGYFPKPVNPRSFVDALADIIST